MLLAFAVPPVAAGEPCKLVRLAELPVTMEGMRPLVHASIDGKDAVFIADSGAFFSMLTPAAAREFNLHLQPTAIWFYLTGIGGDAQVWITTVKKFTIFNLEVPNVPFLVAGNDLGHGAVGLLGQNVFRLGDVEYDLANGVINIMRTRGDCRKASLAYWANAKGLPHSELDIDFATREKPHTTGDAYLNGSKIRVMFDTGASASGLTLKAARRAGITPDSPGVKPGGISWGIGRNTVRTWIAPFASFRIGDEEIRNTHLRILDEPLLSVDMLIGPDFFLSHRVLVASGQRKLYFTYNGGPVFDLTAPPPAPGAATPASGQPAASEPGTAIAAPSGQSTPSQPATPATPQEEQLDAAGYARRGSAFASRRDYEHALADLTRAIELAPGDASYFYQRGMTYWWDRQADKALEDFTQAIKLKPDDVPALMARAELRIGRHETTEDISADLAAADRAAPKEADMRVALGDLYQRQRDYRAAIAQYDRWIDSHNRDDIQVPRVRNSRCWARALLGQELDRALADCNAAVGANRTAAAYLDSRGLVYLRQGRYDKAIADYDAALALNPRIAWALYGRGLARQR
ncbi:MAG: aspartyl protease family protein, partial [Gammaproteobacteria bacterium]|nr:aspartyl protease family protein [Gammaproteobacteria bacterium]